ncbi:MAG: DUF2064 domain-containing protein [Oligoflexales bacterium]|nr:DUF2064 domain-containing protein [Oligoflexales bacterium]
MKTPQLSPVKTRLAAEIGTENAHLIYIQMIDCLRELFQDLIEQNGTLYNVSTFFAVAEPDGLNSKLWRGHPTILQHQGSLGQRLGAVYSHLLQSYDAVFLIGADCPRLTCSDVLQAIDLLKEHKFVAGLAMDGGFYLFAGRENLAETIWTSVNYSSANTLKELQVAIGPQLFTGLPVYSDIDEKKDLAEYLISLRDFKGINASQRALLDLIKMQNEFTN